MDRIELNCITGASTTITLTAAEEAKAIADSIPSAAQVKQAEQAKARVDLEALECANLRDVIAYIAAKADAPLVLKERNLAALVLIEKLK